ncbi:MAG: prepilin-type cleavage/methylation domain-containing protein, partial [Haemophilus parainfluenzae]|nr:prepilin-type cleavage/methylation domain-containing protein [Haemophilus parainfluenzae]
GKTMLIGPKLYPSEVAVKFNGARNTMETNCFMLQAGEHRTLFSFFNVGSIKLKSDQAASACTR